MRQRLTVTTLLLASLACARSEQSLTEGAEDDSTWAQRLGTAVTPGMPADSARLVLQRSGFACVQGVDSTAYLWCDKSESSYHVVRRRWRAVMVLDHDSIVTRRATFGLIGP